jgi:2-keto-4-pentenoate hydratase/2-oxohepta-3-ene-1,7-dioic acid hydratase in catechol pathway
MAAEPKPKVAMKKRRRAQREAFVDYIVASIGDRIFGIPTLIRTIGRSITLQPGDIIATGTPVGVGVGFKPPRYLKPGDSIRIEVSSLGTLENPVL